MAWSFKKALSNFGKGAALGASSGALTGATAGLASGGLLSGPGALAGGVIGGIGGGIASLFQDANEPEVGQSGLAGNEMSEFQQWLFGTPEGQQAFSRFSPEQQKGMMESLRSGQNTVNNPTAGFAPIRENANRNFQGTISGLAHRFSTGGDNALSSPILHAQLGGAATDLNSKLASQEAQYGLKNKQLGIQQQELGLQPMYSQGAQNINIGGMGGPNSNYQTLLNGAIDLWKDYRSNQANKPQGNNTQQVSGQTNPIKPYNVAQLVNPTMTVPALQQRGF